MQVRAKFKVESNTATVDGNRVILKAVYGNNDPTHENSKFFKYTPSGLIDMGVVMPEVGATFVPGMEFYVDFTPVV